MWVLAFLLYAVAWEWVFRFVRMVQIADILGACAVLALMVRAAGRVQK